MQTPSQPVIVEFDVPATMRDGTILRANIFRPAGEGRWPVLLTRLPYGKDLALGSAILNPAQAARRGYVVIVQDTRGTGMSGGEWYPFRAEGDDGMDTLAWAAALPFADGQVGMYGASYFGFTQWVVAVQSPPALKATIPSITWCDPLDGLTDRGGAAELGLGASWNLMMGLGELFRRHGRSPAALGPALGAWAAEFDALGETGYAALPINDFAPIKRHDVAPFFFDVASKPMDRAAVAPVSLLGKHDGVTAPSLNIGGWYDVFLAGTIENFQAMRTRGVPSKLLIGPWIHGHESNPIGERNFGFGAQSSLIDLRIDRANLQLRWFDHWLKGRDTGMMAEPPIKLFVMGANVWRDEQEWPLARAVPTSWYLRANGGLSTEQPADEEPDRYDYDPADPTPTRGGALLMTAEYPGGAFDQRVVEARPDVLVYTSAALADDMEVTGPIAVQLWAISSAPDTDFVARLTDVFPDGRSINLADGIIRARFRHFGAGEAPSPIEPGQAYRYEIDLWATSNVFKAGHRIRLHVTSSCFPRWDRNQNTGHAIGADDELAVARQQILHDRAHPSHVVLPIVPR